MKRLLIIIYVSCSLCAIGQTIVHIDNPMTWTCSELKNYIGQTIEFDIPFYVCNNYQQTAYQISPRRIYSPTNQELPGSAEYKELVSLNNNGVVSLSGVDNYHRMGEKLKKLIVRVNSISSLSLVSCIYEGNTREELIAGPPSVDIVGEHTILVCGFNLEYFLAENLGTGYGPDSKSEHEKQKAKISEALGKIGADIFGFVEIEQGQTALKELAQMLTQKTGRIYSYIDDGGSANSSYTKSGYVYCTQTVEPVGRLLSNEVGVSNRKKMQTFMEKQTGEKFIFSINHFKAKSGSASGDNANQGDGQGSYNATRVAESKAIIKLAEEAKKLFEDDDVLVMGDLNAYAKEDPIIEFLNVGMVDLHRYFHADSSYSYVYHGQAGYLDHAIANRSLTTQITGIAAYHINSDEDDRYTYDKSNDLSMFRCSDHDPVLVGLRLGAEFETNLPPEEDSRTLYDKCDMDIIDGQVLIVNNDKGYFRIYNSFGELYKHGSVTDDYFVAAKDLPQGVYIINLYVDNKVKQYKILIP
ncbi:MAG: endonuclease/exonuclease/phosphatase family protein [Paludibacteraceae bacterium]|nr:endonuclease/exonuclease/phosphatase family protein [Paludibacteraceae bacterium]